MFHIDSLINNLMEQMGVLEAEKNEIESLLKENNVSYQELKDFLPQKKQAMYNDDLAGKPQPKREVDNARKLFVDAAKQMEKDGSLNLEDILSGGEMVE